MQVVETKDAMFSDNYLVKIHVKNSLTHTHTLINVKNSLSLSLSHTHTHTH